ECGGLSRTAVNFHIDYLAREKLRVKEPSGAGRADWQRAAPVSVALRFDLVRAEHLHLLPPPPRRSRSPPRAPRHGVYRGRYSRTLSAYQRAYGGTPRAEIMSRVFDWKIVAARI